MCPGIALYAAMLMFTGTFGSTSTMAKGSRERLKNTLDGYTNQHKEENTKAGLVKMTTVEPHPAGPVQHGLPKQALRMLLFGLYFVLGSLA